MIAKLSLGKKRAEIAETTGPLEGLRRRRTVVMADLENLMYGARDLGVRIRLDALGERLRAASGGCELHAFFSRTAGDDVWVRLCESAGWEAHPREIRTVRTCRGVERHANADNLFAFGVGWYLRDREVDAVVLASGDGALVCDLASELQTRLPFAAIHTLSLAGSTSHSLDCRVNRHLDGNIEIGRDCLEDCP